MWLSSLFVFLSADAGQILQQHDACWVFILKSYGMKLLQIPTFMDSQVPIWTNYRTHFLNVIITHGCRRVSRFGIIFCGSSSRFEMLLPLMTLWMAQTTVLKGLLSIWKVSVRVLPNLKQNFMQKHCSSRSFIA